MEFEQTVLNFIKRNPIISAIAGVVVLAIVGGGIFLLTRQSSTTPNINNPAATQEEVRKLVAEVGKLMDLPVGEDPTIATVTDVDTLKAQQPFFQNAQNGDKVLIYSGVRKAILYSPSRKRVIDVAPINVGSPSAQVSSPEPLASPSPTSSPTPKP